jgi:hypothetical protein
LLDPVQITGLQTHPELRGQLRVGPRHIGMGAFAVAVAGRVERIGPAHAQAQVIAAFVAGAQAPLVAAQVQAGVQRLGAGAERAGGAAGAGAAGAVAHTLGILRHHFFLALGAADAQVSRHVECAEFAAVLHPGVLAVEAARTCAQLGAMDLGGGFGDEVDDTGVGIGPVQRRARATNDFNAGNVLQWQAAPGVAFVAAVQRGHGHAVLQQQDLRVGGVAVDAAHHVDRLVDDRRARHMQAGHGLQHLVQIGGAAGGNVVGGDDGGHRRGAAQGLLAAGDQADAVLVAINRRQIGFIFGHIGRCSGAHPGQQEAGGHAGGPGAQGGQVARGGVLAADFHGFKGLLRRAQKQAQMLAQSDGGWDGMGWREFKPELLQS